MYEVKKENDEFLVITNQGNFISKNIVLATGTKASQKDDLSNIGYKTCEKFGIKLCKVLPALVQLKGNEKYFKEWNGIRIDSKVSLYENDKFIAEEIGELQLTDYGISGICAMNLSGRISRGLNENKTEYVKLNFLEGLNINSIGECVKFIDLRNNMMKNRTICELLEGIINYKLLNILLKKNNINLNKKWNEISNDIKEKIVSDLVALKINIIGTNSFEKAQVCSGGVLLKEINCSSMESNKVKGLYIVGELLDQDADCGGYNLTWAWITGMLAGKSI